MLEIFAELKRNAVKRDELLSELLTIPVTAAQWRHIVETMLGGDFKVTTFEPIPYRITSQFQLDEFDQETLVLSIQRHVQRFKNKGNAKNSFFRRKKLLRGTGETSRHRANFSGRAGPVCGPPKKNRHKKTLSYGKPSTDSAVNTSVRC